MAACCQWRQGGSVAAVSKYLTYLEGSGAAPSGPAPAFEATLSADGRGWTVRACGRLCSYFSSLCRSAVLSCERLQGTRISCHEVRQIRHWRWRSWRACRPIRPIQACRQGRNSFGPSLSRVGIQHPYRSGVGEGGSSSSLFSTICTLFLPTSGHWSGSGCVRMFQSVPCVTYRNKRERMGTWGGSREPLIGVGTWAWAPSLPAASSGPSPVFAVVFH